MWNITVQVWNIVRLSRWQIVISLKFFEVLLLFNIQLCVWMWNSRCVLLKEHTNYDVFNCPYQILQFGKSFIVHSFEPFPLTANIQCHFILVTVNCGRMVILENCIFENKLAFMFRFLFLMWILVKYLVKTC